MPQKENGKASSVLLRSTPVAGKESNTSPLEMRERAMGTVIACLKESAPDLDWDFGLNQVTFDLGGPVAKGAYAMAKTIGVIVMGTSSRMGWELKSPEIVYIVGSHISKELNRKRNHIKTKLADAGNRRFESEEKKKIAIAREKELFADLDKFVKPFDSKLTSLAEDILLQDEKYLVLLRWILTTNYNKRETALTLIRENRLDEAYQLMDF